MHHDRGGLLLASRFGAQFEVGMPDEHARKQILRIILTQHNKEMPSSVSAGLFQVCCPHLAHHMHLCQKPSCCLIRG